MVYEYPTHSQPLLRKALLVILELFGLGKQSFMDYSPSLSSWLRFSLVFASNSGLAPLSVLFFFLNLVWHQEKGQLSSCGNYSICPAGVNLKLIQTDTYQNCLSKSTAKWWFDTIKVYGIQQGNMTWDNSSSRFSVPFFCLCVSLVTLTKMMHALTSFSTNRWEEDIVHSWIFGKEIVLKDWHIICSQLQHNEPKPQLSQNDQFVALSQWPP